MSDQAERLRQLAKASRKEVAPIPSSGARVLAVASGKGGVGKTNMVANVGWALARRGRKVLALDADFGLANLDILLNLAPEKNLGHFLRGEADAAEIIAEAAPGFSVLPGASGIQELAELDGSDRARIVAGLAGVASGYDFILLDTAAGIGRNVVELCLAARDVLLVTDPQPTSLTDAYGLAKVLIARDRDIPIGVVVNSVASAAEGRAVCEKLSEVVKRFIGRELNYVGHVVKDDCVARATRRQQPFVSLFPRAKASECVEAVAASLIEGSNGAAGATSFWTRLAERGKAQ